MGMDLLKLPLTVILTVKQPLIKIIFAESFDVLLQWFSTFLLERNSNEKFQWLEEPLSNNLIVLYNLCNFWWNLWTELEEP